MVPVTQIVQRAAQLMQHHFQISNVEFKVHFDDEQVTLLCDENQIQQALVALFVNAVEAMPERGTLSVEVSKKDENKTIRIAITDSGSGIAEEDVTHIFEPFFTTKKDGKGVGLGLSVVYGIIERHGGDISVQSGIGKGTTFTLIFPQTDAKQARQDAGAPEQPVANTTTVS